MQKYKVLIITAVIVIGYAGYTFFTHHEGEFKSSTNAVISSSTSTVAKPGNSTNSYLDKLVGQAGNVDTVQAIKNYVQNDMAGHNASSPQIAAATNDYLKYRFLALSSTNKTEIIDDYKQAFVAMSCSQRYLKQNNQDAYVLFKNLNAIVLNDQTLQQKQKNAEKSLSGQVFIDMTPAEKTKQCKKLYQ